MFVYELYCRPSGKSYIGVAKDVESRFKTHSRSQSAIGSAVRKYGPESFDKKVLFEGEPETCYAEEARLVRERETIAPQGYNLTEGGKGVRGHAPEVLTRMSAAVKASHSRPETKAKLSKSARHQWSDSETKERARATNVTTWSDPVKRQNHAELMRAINTRPEVRQQLSDKAKKQWTDPAFRLRMSELMKQRNQARIAAHP